MALMRGNSRRGKTSSAARLARKTERNQASEDRARACGREKKKKKKKRGGSGKRSRRRKQSTVVDDNEISRDIEGAS